jgi:hypothetical protein
MKNQVTQRIQYPAAVAPPAWELADASALQALVRGEADALQQQRALNWIINTACGTYDLDYRPDPRDHAFVSGKRFVGLELVKLLKINTGAFRKQE